MAAIYADRSAKCNVWVYARHELSVPSAYGLGVE